jgi:hypothetical protein
MNDEEGEHHMTDKPVSLEEERFLRDVERGKYPTLGAGSAPVRELVRWMENNDMVLGNIFATLIYNAAAETFRNLDSPEIAEQFVRVIVEAVLADLRQNGPEPK